MKEYPEIIGADATPFTDVNRLEQLKMKTAEVSEKDIEYVEKNFWKKLSQAKIGVKFKRDLLALYKFMKDPKVSLLKKALAISALLYFILPLDSIPDVAPLVGFLDDIGIITAVIAYLNKLLKPYYD